MSKITASAKGQTCTIRIPGYCNFNPETTVACHINGIRFKHGVASKAPDFLMAHGCSGCHDVIDGRVPTAFSQDYIKRCHYEGVFETQLRLMDKGLL